MLKTQQLLVIDTWEPQHFQYENFFCDLLPYLAKFCWADEWSHYHSTMPAAPHNAFLLSAKVSMHKAQQKEPANLKMGVHSWVYLQPLLQQLELKKCEN